MDSAKPLMVSKAIEAITQQFTDWQPAQGRANEHLYSLLGRIYEASSAIDTDKAAKVELLAEVKRIDALSRNNRWDPTKKTSAELLLSILLGLSAENKGTKSQWLSAVRAAKAQGVKPTETAYVKWIKGVGGVVAARKALKGKDAGGDQLLSKFSLKGFSESFSNRTEPFNQIRLPIDPATEMHDGFSVVLVHRGVGVDGKWNDKLDVVAKVSEAGLVQKVAMAVEQGRIANPLPDADDLQLMEAQLLLKLNHFALKQAKYWGRGASANELKAFILALRRLESEPMLARKYFDGETNFEASVFEGTKRGSFEVVNEEYDDFDPGRFIGNAKRAKLVPYEAVIGDKRKTKENFYKFRNSLKSLKERVKMKKLGAVLEDKTYVQH